MNPLLVALLVGIVLVGVFSFSAAEMQIPEWIKNNAKWWADGLISDSDFVKGIEFLINSGIIKVQSEKAETSDDTVDTMCLGNARCITGTVTAIVDGDTIKVDGKSIRFALSSAPELNEPGGIEARDFIKVICSVGSTATVDEDDGQTQGSYGRILGVIYCNGVNLNAELLDVGRGYLLSNFCDASEFANEHWAQKHGCSTVYDEPVESTLSCDSSYPDFCIPPPPPDLDCKDIPQKRFTVLKPDPHRFDGDKDGIGCES